MNFSLSDMQLNELKSLQQQVTDEIKSREQSEIATARKQILELAAQAGISINELRDLGLGKKIKDSGEPKPTREIKFRDPENPVNEWVGVGPRPQWMRDKIAAGANAADFKV